MYLTNKKCLLVVLILALCLGTSACDQEPFSDATDQGTAVEVELYVDTDLGVEAIDVFMETSDASGKTEFDDEGFETRQQALGTSRDVVYIVIDGAANDERIRDAYLEARGETPGWSWMRGAYLNSWCSVSTIKAEVDAAVSRFGKPRSSLNLLLIGKSMGAAKTYKAFYNYSSSFDDFQSTAVVLVDSHEPGYPGDEGRSNYWYDYVRFRNNTSSWKGDYDLAWQSRWNNFGSKLKVFNLYQREKWPRGYSFTNADINQKTKIYDHTTIADSHYAVNYIGDAIGFLVN